MYLLAKRHLNNNGDVQLFPDTFSKVEEVTSCKANHIHGWFVKLLKKIVLCSGLDAISREELENLRIPGIYSPIVIVIIEDWAILPPNCYMQPKIEKPIKRN
jgi:hypothetical protein